LNSISPAAFGRIKCSICCFEEVAPFRGCFALKSRQSKASGNIRDFPPEAELFTFETLPNSFDGGECILFSYMAKDQDEFLHSDSTTDVSRPGICPQDISKFLQDQIPGVVTVGIINALEAVQIRHDYPER